MNANIGTPLTPAKGNAGAMRPSPPRRGDRQSLKLDKGGGQVWLSARCRQKHDALKNFPKGGTASGSVPNCTHGEAGDVLFTL